MSACGEWFSAIEALRGILKDLQDRERGEQITWRKVDIGLIILELNRFGYYDDISDAENAFLECIEQDLSLISPQLFLVIVYIRQGRFDDAQDKFTQVKGILAKSHSIVSFEKEKLSRIEFEIEWLPKFTKEKLETPNSNFNLNKNKSPKSRALSTIKSEGLKNMLDNL